MDKDIRNALEKATQRARKQLEADFSSQLEGTFDVASTAAVAAKGGVHLSARHVFQRDKIVAAIEHKRATGMTAAEAVTDYARDAAFTTLNRFVASQDARRSRARAGVHQQGGAGRGLSPLHREPLR